jgi:pimeloyl-ACP methyl ester carboxylesterase
VNADIVVLVHGLWMHGLVMGLMQRRIARHGYAVRAHSYSSVRCDLRENAVRLAAFVQTLGSSRAHFVAHSLGGIVAMNAAALMPRESLGRIVLVGTPFAESFSGRRLERLPAGRSLLGACMTQWLYEPRLLSSHTVRSLDVGVIAGTGGVGMGRFIAPGLPKPNDGVVAVEETRVPGMRDHIVLPVSHTAMLVSREVARQTCAFLDNGRFERSGIPAA